jgi:hypothetical protein
MAPVPDVQEPEPEEIQATVTPASDEWYPYPNKWYTPQSNASYSSIMSFTDVSS